MLKVIATSYNTRSFTICGKRLSPLLGKGIKKGVPARGADTPSSEGKGTHEKANTKDRNIIIRLIIFVNKGLLTLKGGTFDPF